MTVTRCIHQTWKTKSVPYWLAKYVASWIVFNPEWKYTFWTDGEIDDFIHDKFPKLEKVYDNLPIDIMRVDLARYCIIKIYGGVYVDLDFECYRAIDDVIDKYDLTLSWEWAGSKSANATGKGEGIDIDNVKRHFYSELSEDHKVDKPSYEYTLGNAILASSPEHPFWDSLIEKISTYTSLQGVTNSDVFRLTGPQFLTEQFVRNYDVSWNANLLNNSYFFPIPWSRPSTDDGYRASNFPEAYGAHHWNGSWWQRKPDSEDRCVMVGEILNNPDMYMVS